jgi:hypothetical protein
MARDGLRPVIVAQSTYSIVQSNLKMRTTISDDRSAIV